MSTTMCRWLAIGSGFLLVLNSCNEPAKDKTPWVSLFDGETLTGWSSRGGKATYSVADAAIVGETVANTPNTFLVTDAVYADFILELEYKADPVLNSGIQIRSDSFPYYKNGQFHGYQIEIDQSDRAWSGGIYDEGRRGWLNPLTQNPKAQAAFKHQEWNHYRIEAIADTIKTWVNGVPAAHLIDDKTPSGRIGLQVHSIGKDDSPGAKIRWRNIKIITQDVATYAQPSPISPIHTKNQLTPTELDQGWQLLWDGKSTQGWRGAKLDHFPKQGWEISNGALTVLATGGAEAAAGGDIVTTQKYADFHLKVDFKITEGANSGIKYYVDTALNQGAGSSIGLEFQILDDAKHPDAKKGNHAGSRTVASLYDLIKASDTKHMNPIGAWNTAEIISAKGKVTHYLNGTNVLSYQRAGEAYRKLVAESKYKVWPNFGEAATGHILLQDHGDRVSFKNIKIKPLNE